MTEHPYRYIADLERVIDGDTIVVVLDLGFDIYRRETLRLRGIDAPEKRGEERVEGLLSKAYLEQLLGDSRLTIETHKTDKYGRYVADVYCGGENVAQRMVMDGQAITYGEG